MTGTPWPLTLLGLPLWFGPPFLLLLTASRARVVRVASGATLAVTLTFLYAVCAQLLQGPWLPIASEGLVLWGPTTLVVCGAAFLADKWMSGSQASGVSPGSGATASKPVARRGAARWLVAAIVGWSACCGGCVLSPAAEFVDLRFDSPAPGLVLPMPAGLSLVSADRDCGSESCSEAYRVGSPDQAGVPELTDRLWAHLAGTKGWQRLRDDSGCRRSGWFIQNEFCLYVRVERAGPDAVLEVHVTGGL